MTFTVFIYLYRQLNHNIIADFNNYFDVSIKKFIEIIIWLLFQ